MSKLAAHTKRFNTASSLIESYFGYDCATRLESTYSSGREVVGFEPIGLYTVTVTIGRKGKGWVIDTINVDRVRLDTRDLRAVRSSFAEALISALKLIKEQAQ